jgi:hypothetical protein
MVSSTVQAFDDPVCRLEAIFVMDTSSSMTDEGDALCNDIDQVIMDLEAAGIEVQPLLLAITPVSPGCHVFPCLTDTVSGVYGTAVPGDPPAGLETLGDCPPFPEVPCEDWGRLADEGPYCGNPITGLDTASVDHAVSVANANAVTVSTITGTGSSGGVIALAQALADGTGGLQFASTDPAEDLFLFIKELVLDACLFDLDIKPGSCPNSYNRNSSGVLPVALVGMEGFDVAEVDIDTIQLSRADDVGGSVAPHEGPPGPHTVMEDVATPFPGELCDCHELTGDGIMDLSLKFKSGDLVEALELDGLPAGSLVELVVSGQLLGGTEFAASDCIRIVPPGDINGDGAVGVADLLILLATWGSCPAPPAECAGDLDGTGSVGVLDLLALLADWGWVAPPPESAVRSVLPRDDVAF